MRLALVAFTLSAFGLSSAFATYEPQYDLANVFDRAPEELSAMFSPWEGTEAFDKMYSQIATAKEDVKVTAYSWSDPGFDKALEAAVRNGATVRVVLHPDLAKTDTTKARMTKLEAIRAKGKVSFKVAPRNMHEKFAVIDGVKAVNSSANMSNGAKTKYSENFVFFDGPQSLIQSFENEFAILWNSSKDFISAGEVVEERIPYNANQHQLSGKDVILYSSSMNYNYAESAATAGEGRFIKLVDKDPRNNTRDANGAWVVRDAIISAIKNAKTSIYCSFNHFNILEISKELVEAARRGVDVKLTVDNQEFREKWSDKGIEMTPYFVENWKKLPGNADKEAPARVKFYSHSPNPALWLLNHHKFLLVDYNANGGSDKSVLVTGSYNLSKTAELNQFDNMVIYKGKKYASLQNSFLGEFNKLWSLERKGDKPNPELVSFFTTVQNDSLPIHSTKAAVSLTWSEIMEIRNTVKSIAPEFLSGMNFSTRGCQGYNVKTKMFFGCH